MAEMYFASGIVFVLIVAGFVYLVKKSKDKEK